MNDHTALLDAIITTREKKGGIETPRRTAKITIRAGEFVARVGTFRRKPAEKLAA